MSRGRRLAILSLTAAGLTVLAAYLYIPKQRAPLPPLLPRETVSPPEEAPTPQPRVNQVFLSPENRYLIISMAEGGAMLLPTEGEWSELIRTDRSINNLSFSPTGSKAAYDEEGHTGSSRVFLATDSLYALHILHGCEDFAELEWSPDGAFLYGLSWGVYNKWRVSDGARVWQQKLAENIFDIHVSRIVRGTDGRYVLASIGWGEPMRLWDSERQRFTREFSDLRVLFPDKPYAIEKHGTAYRIVNVVTGVVVRQLPATLKNIYGGVSPNGELLGTRSEDKKTLGVYRLSDGSLLSEVELGEDVIGQYWKFLTDRTIAIPIEDKVHLWDLDRGRLALTIIPDVDPKARNRKWVAYTPDGRFTGSGHLPGEKDDHWVQKVLRDLFGVTE